MRPICKMKMSDLYPEPYNPNLKRTKLDKKLKHKAERKYYKKQIDFEILSNSDMRKIIDDCFMDGWYFE